MFDEYSASLFCLRPVVSHYWREMQDYSFTDEATVARISQLAPRALSAYFLCLHTANEMGICHFTRDEIIHDHVRSWTKFKNDIRALASLYLLDCLTLGDKIDVQLCVEEEDDMEIYE